MNAGQLSAWAQQNRTVLLVAGVAGAAGLGLLHRRKAGSPAAGAPGGSAGPAASAGGQTAGATGGAAYDSTATDVASWLSPQLETIIGRLPGSSSTPPTPVPAQGKVAGTLLAPAGSGQYVRDKRGMIAEVESDGSLLALTNAQWTAIARSLGKNLSVTQLRGQLGGTSGMPVYDVEHNLRRLNAPPATTAAPTPTTATPPTPVTNPAA